MKKTNELQKLVDKFRADANRVLAKMVTDAFGGSVMKPPPKRGGALLQMEMESQLSAAAQSKPKKTKAKTAKTSMEARRYQRAWRLKKKKADGKPLSKSQEAWLARYDAKK